MKITMYELLGLVKDGKAPKKIKYDELIWEYTGYQYERIDKENLGNIWNGYNFNILDNEVEILEEEKKIPEKLDIEQDKPGKQYYIRNEYGTKCGLTQHSRMIAEKLNEVIDYLDYLKSKGDE